MAAFIPYGCQIAVLPQSRCCWRIRLEDRGPWVSPPPEPPSYPNCSLSAAFGNSPTVTYAADAAPGMMKMESSCGSPEDGRRVSGRRPFDQLRPRARPTVWPGRRPIPGIVTPGPPGSTWSRLSSTATSPATGLRRIRDDVGRFRTATPRPSDRASSHGSRPLRAFLTPAIGHGGPGACCPPRQFRTRILGAVSAPQGRTMPTGR